MILFNDIVVSYYPKNHISWIQNIKTYIAECNYPRCNFETINLNQRYIVCSLSNGKVSYNPCNILKFCKDLLNFNIKAKQIKNYMYNDSMRNRLKKYNIDDIISYVQHGDVSACNILWDKSQYELIDFDLIGIYPALYDFFTCLTYESIGLFGLPCFIKGYFDIELIKLFNVSATKIEQIKDSYLAIFLIFRQSRLKCNISVLKKFVPDSYFTCWSVINDYQKV